MLPIEINLGISWHITLSYIRKMYNERGEKINSFIKIFSAKMAVND
jgi:hypothetical protein